MSKPLVNAAGLHKSYAWGAPPSMCSRACRWRWPEGEFVAIMGASGCGKSTLLHLLGALDLPDRGTVSFEGTDVFAGSNARRDHLRNPELRLRVSSIISFPS